MLRICGLSDTIIHDQGHGFTLTVWKHFCKCLGIQHSLSTTYHPVTDGQNKSAYPLLEIYLGKYVNYIQDNWATLLPADKFATNIHVSASTQSSSFLASYKHNPGMSLISVLASPKFCNIDAFVQQMASIHHTCTVEISWAQAEQDEYAHCHQISAHVYKVRYSVRLYAKDFQRKRLSRKLNHHYKGLFEVIKILKTLNVQLHLPQTMKNRNMFHVRLIKHCSRDALPGQIAELPGSVITIGNKDKDKYDVEVTWNSCRCHCYLKYQVN